MEENQPSKESKPISLNEISFEAIPVGQGPKPHSVRQYEPRVVDDHFRPLLKNSPSAEERWADKADQAPFPGV
jgi:hypothetical protein